MRSNPVTLIPSLLILGACALLLPGAAWADGAEPEYVVEVIEAPVIVAPDEVIVIERDPEPEATIEVHQALRALTACEQMRIDIYDMKIHISQDKKADRRAAYAAMRAGDPTARYLCLTTKCTPERLNMLAHRLDALHEHRRALNLRIAQGPLGASDICCDFHGTMLAEMFDMHDPDGRYRWAGGHFGHNKKFRKGDKKDRGAKGENTPEPRLDPYEEEQAREYARRRAERGY